MHPSAVKCIYVTKSQILLCHVDVSDGFSGTGGHRADIPVRKI